MPFQICSQSTPSLDDVVVATGSWHNHSINMCFVEQSIHDRNSWGDVQFSGLANLTFMAGADVPFDVIDQHRPPEAQQQTCLDWKDTLVPKAIVCLLNESVMMPNWHNQLMLSMLLSTVQRPIEKEKASGHIDEGHVVWVWEIRRMDVIMKKFTNSVNLIIFSMSFCSTWDGQVIVVWIQVSNDENRDNAGWIQASRQGIIIWCNLHKTATR